MVVEAMVPELPTVCVAAYPDAPPLRMPFAESNAGVPAAVPRIHDDDDDDDGGSTRVADAAFRGIDSRFGFGVIEPPVRHGIERGARRSNVCSRPCRDESRSADGYESCK